MFAPQRRLPRPVHPRPRGEHLSASPRCSASSGSSPPTRGTPVATAIVGVAIRFIPAHAGNTVVSCSPYVARAVHPRPRGEHKAAERGTTSTSGSSPPTRGTPGAGIRRQSGSRFIPAHAGNTREILYRQDAPAVHPRPRGEHINANDFQITIDGSSPPTRGTPHAHQVHVLGLRFIPAHAGNTQLAMPCGFPPAVHPRPRGEHIKRKRNGNDHDGSSPPTRGTPDQN